MLDRVESAGAQGKVMDQVHLIVVGVDGCEMSASGE